MNFLIAIFRPSAKQMEIFQNKLALRLLIKESNNLAHVELIHHQPMKITWFFH